jgi:hypothetical protein
MAFCKCAGRCFKIPLAIKYIQKMWMIVFWIYKNRILVAINFYYYNNAY